MARSLSQTLIRSSIPFLFSTSRDAVRLVSSHQYSNHSKSTSSRVVEDPPSPEMEAIAVRKIEDAIHEIAVRQLTPDWLPFVPGASFWVPPKRHDYSIAEMVNEISHSSFLSDDEVMSILSIFGWPSVEFFIQDASPHQTAGDDMSSLSPFISLKK